ncbi:MAG: glycerophosphodiester phosphodiesterase family protein [Acidimicrobiales bacterium]
MPPSPWPYLDHPGVLAFAHRGGAGERPENTLAAFEHAVRLGYRHVETDVRVTADGVLVAFHDETLDRVTDHGGLVRELPWSTVRHARVAGTEPPLLLEDLLGAWPDLRVNVDAKDDAAVEPLAAVVRRTASLDRVGVGGFSGRRLRRLRRLLGPRLCAALGPLGVARLRAASVVGIPTGRLAAACVQVPVRTRRVPLVDGRFVAAAHRRGLQVHVWTVDDPTEMARLLDLGVDGLMTDRPSVLKGVLEARGDWA